jgi:hypothetical protein
MLDFSRHHADLLEILKKPLFFIGGAMKSGTTWLQLTLDAHPQVSCRGEGHFTNQLAPGIIQALTDYNSYLEGKNRHIFNEIEGYPALGKDDVLYMVTMAIALGLRRHPKALTARAVGEKTPDNVRAFDLLAKLFPQAKFIHVVRDGRDSAVSGWFHNLRSAPEDTLEKYGTKQGYLARFAKYWSFNVGAGAAFGTQQPERYRAIRYEDLLEAPDHSLGGLFDFLGVESSPEILADCRSAAAFERLSGGRETGTEDQESFFRKGVAGDWPGHFDDEMRALFETEAGKWLDQFGYL